MTHCHDPDRCPCGGGKAFADCCKLILKDHSAAKTAEQLMRSRYTAFTLGDNKYLLKSWAQSTRPETIQADDPALHWLGLEVKECEGGLENDTTGTVTFTARFLSSGHFCQLHECSRFIREERHWYYRDGESSSERHKVARNSPCPCGSGKKYKRCCC